MSDGDIFTDNNRSFSPSSQDTSSLDSIPSTTQTPRRNPYTQQNQSQRSKLTAQSIYTATNQKSQQTITRWLISDNSMQPPNTVPNKKKSLPMTKLRTKRQPQCTIQTPLHQLLANDHWGDAPSTNPMSFRVISKNVNSLSTKEHNLQWRRAVHAMQEMDAHVLCIQEPNLCWHTGILQPIYKIFQKAFMHAKMTTSNSTAPHPTQATISPVEPFLLQQAAMRLALLPPELIPPVWVDGRIMNYLANTTTAILSLQLTVWGLNNRPLAPTWPILNNTISCSLLIT